MTKKLQLKIINPNPNKQLDIGSTILLQIKNISNYVLFLPSELEYIDFNSLFVMYAITNNLQPVPIVVKSIDSIENTTILNPLVTINIRLEVMENVIFPEDFIDYTLIMRMFNEY